MKYLALNDLISYKKALRLSNFVWTIVINWGWFEKRTIGAQFVEAVDSNSANIAEGFGRYGKKDKIKFYRYSYGSVKESLDWNEKAKARNLLTMEQYRYILRELQSLPREINHLIEFTKAKLKE